MTDNDAAKALEWLVKFRHMNESDQDEVLDEHALKIETIRKALAKSAKVDESGLPCVSCGKPSQVATPDDADMCHECFGQFNAREYDLLKKQADGLLEALKPFANVADRIKEHATDNRWLEQCLFSMGDDTDPLKWSLTGNAFNDASSAIQRFNGEG